MGGLAAMLCSNREHSFFQVDHIEGFIGYRHVAKCALVFGDPVCHKDDMKALAHAFNKHLKQRGIKAIYIASTDEFAKVAMDHVCDASIHWGEELVFNPEINPKDRTGPHACLVRRKIKRALKEGISAHEHADDNPQLEQEIEEAGKVWKAKRRGRQTHISDFYLFENRMGKRWFYAKKEGKVVGGVSLNQIKSCEGWLINHLFVLPEAAKGTSELLFTTALEALKEEGCRHATIGYVPGSELYSIVGLGKITTYVAHKIYNYARKAFGLDKLKVFWNKFTPNSQPVYILFNRKEVRIKDLLMLANSMNSSSTKKDD